MFSTLNKDVEKQGVNNDQTKSSDEKSKTMPGTIEKEADEISPATVEFVEAFLKKRMMEVEKASRAPETMEEAEKFLKRIHARANLCILDYIGYVKVVHMFRNQFWDREGEGIDSKILTKAACQHLGSAMLILGSRVGTFLSVEQIKEIHNELKDNKDYMDFLNSGKADIRSAN